ncbi:MAG TPA: DUF2301 domain-containing membrane protein [Candidatus Caenarcaniphilales bacterium]
MTDHSSEQPEVYQGQFGEFTITQADRRGVIIYRSALLVAAFCFAIGTVAVLWQGDSPTILKALSINYACFCLALGVSLATIHIYLAPLHRTLQICWVIGCTAAIWVAFHNEQPLAMSVYRHPETLIGVGFTFVALTGIFFKEAFCFNRLETKLLTPLIPFLLLGHWAGVLPVQGEQALLACWAILFLVFGLRKAVQPIPPDIGDKTVFAYLAAQRSPVASVQSK